MKETFYFRHDYNARNDERILELRADHGYEGYGIYWALVESLAESSDGHLNGGAIAGLAVGLGIDRAKLEAVIETCIRSGLLTREGNRLFSRRIIAHKQERELYANSGKKGAKARWSKVAEEKQKNSPPIGGASSHPNSKERRGKESKEKKSTYVVRAETEMLYGAIDELCRRYDIANEVDKKALDVIVERYVGKVRMKVELQHCVAWLVDKKFKSLNTQRLGNWLKKAQEIQKRDQLKQLERKEAEINPAMANRRERMKLKEGFDASDSVRDFVSSQTPQ